MRVLVLDDDPTFRRILVRTFEKVPGARVIAAVGTLAEAKRHIEGGQVDLVSIDVVLERESGLDLLPWLARAHPKVVAVLLTSGSERKASQTIDAVLLGAASLVLKPSGPTAPQQLQEALTRIVTGLRPPPLAAAPATHQFAPVFPSPREVVAIGASTGGPPVVLQFLRGLPSTFQVPLLITQHMAAEHIDSYAQMLSYPGGRPVRLASQGDWLLPNTVYLAANNRHMGLVRLQGRLAIATNDGPEENFCRPAVDPMFRSVAEVCREASVGVVMTGMGTDGAKGALALRGRGAPVIAQDQKSSVTWGMPGATVGLGAASAVAPGPQLAEAVLRVASGWLHRCVEAAS